MKLPLLFTLYIVFCSNQHLSADAQISEEEILSTDATTATKKPKKIDVLKVQERLAAGTIYVGGNAQFCKNAAVQNNLLVGGSELIQGNLLVESSTTFANPVVLPTTPISTLVLTANPQQSCLIFKNASNQEKARICSQPTAGVNGLFVSVDGGATQNVTVTTTGALAIAAPTSGAALTVTGAINATPVAITASGTGTTLQLVGNQPSLGTDDILTIDPASGIVRQGKATITDQILNGGQSGPITIGTTDATSLSFITNSNDTLSFNATGNATIAAPTTGNALVTNNTQGAALVVMGNSTTVAPALRLLNVPTSSATDALLTIDAAGNVTQTEPLSMILVNGGQPGPLSIGTTNATDFIFITNNSPALIFSASGLIQTNDAVSIQGNLPFTQLTVQQTSLPTNTETSTVTKDQSTNSPIFVYGNYAYLVNGSPANSISIFDISNPTAPQQISTLPISNIIDGSTLSLSVQGQYAYVTQSSSPTSDNLLIFTISNPAASALITTSSASTSTLSANVAQGTYLFAGSDGGLLAYDLTSTFSPTIVAQPGIGVGYSALAAQGPYLYGVNPSDGSLEIFDISDPLNPDQISTGVPLGATNAAIAVQGRYLYSVSTSAGILTLTIIDLLDPTNPVVASTTTNSGFDGNPAISVQGRSLYITLSTNNPSAANFLVYDVSDPTAPVQIAAVSNVATGQEFSNIAIAGLSAIIPANGAFELYDVGSAYIQQAEAGGMEAATIQTLGNMSINTDLNVTGGATVGGSLLVQGNMGVNGTINQASDERKKTSIQPLKDIRSKLMALQPLVYAWTAQARKENANLDDKTHMGFFAQEVAHLFPELVTQNVDGYYALEYSALLAVLVATLTEQNKCINQHAQLLEKTRTDLAVQAEEVANLQQQIDLLLPQPTLTKSVPNSLTVRGKTLCKSLYVGGDLVINHDLRIKNNLGIQASALVDENLLIQGAAEFAQPVTFNQLQTYGLTLTGNPEQACIIFNDASRTEKARICSSPTAGDHGVFVSVNGGATQNVRIANNGGLVLAAPTSGATLTVEGNATSPAVIITGSNTLELVGNQPSQLSDYLLALDPLTGMVHQGPGSVPGEIVNNGQEGPLTIGTLDATPFTFITNNAQRMSTDAQGQSTIFAPTAGQALTITGNTNGAAVIATGNGTSTAPALRLLNNPPSQLGDMQLSIDAAGTVTQGTIDFSMMILPGGQPGPLTIGTTDATSLSILTNNNARASFDSLGNMLITGSVSIGTQNSFAQLVVSQTYAVDVGSVISSSSIEGLFVQGRNIYTVSAQDSTVNIFDYSNPTNPVFVQSIDSADQPFGVSVQGNYAYTISNGASSFGVFNVPTTTQLNDPLNFGAGAAQTFYIQGAYAYVGTNGSPSLYVTNLYNSATPTTSGSVYAGNVTSLYAQGRYVYSADSLGNLYITDISNPAAPLVVSTTPIAGIQSVTVQGRYAYCVVADGSAFQIIDIYNPALPTLVGNSIAIQQSNTGALVAQGRYVYVITNTAMTIIDVSDPQNPFVVGTGGSFTAATNIAVQGRYAIITDSADASIHILDLGGSYLQQVEVGGMEVGTLQTRGAVIVNNNLSVQGGVVIGQSLSVQGNLGIGGTISQVSDKRKKDSICSLHNALSRVTKLQPVQFIWSAQARTKYPWLDHKKHVGFLAQQVEKIMPELITHDEHYGYALDYLGLVPFCTAALQEQEEKIQQQAQELAQCVHLQEKQSLRIAYLLETAQKLTTPTKDLL